DRSSRLRQATSSPEAQTNKSRPRGDAHHRRQGDEHGERHDEKIREPEPRQHPTEIVPDQIRADRSSDESGSRADDHPYRKNRRFARARAREDDSKNGIDRGRERDPDESQRGAAGTQPRPTPTGDLVQLSVAYDRLG